MPKCDVPLPAGSLKVAFKGEDAFVSGVSEDSPLFGVVKIGYKFVDLTLGDGSKMEGLDTYELVAALNESSDDTGRVMKFDMLLPEKSTVTLAPGAHGLIIEDKYNKATITRIDSSSPLKKELRVGMVVDSIELVDGYMLYAGSAMEINSLLESGESDPKRTLNLISPTATPSPRKIILPKYKKIIIPAGSSTELGLTLGGDVAKIQSVKGGSPISSEARPGYYVEKLSMPEGHFFTGLSGVELAQAINKTSDVEGREILLKNPEYFTLPTEATTTVMLPDEGDCADLGFTIGGSPAKITSIDPSSFVFGLLFTGHYTRQFGWADGTCFSDLSAVELEEVIGDSQGLSGRYLTTSSGKAPAASVVTVVLPKGKAGAVFKSSPPKCTRINPGSPLDGQIEVGMVADTLTLPNGVTYYQMDTMEFTSALKSSADQEGRMVRFINPAEVSLTPKPDSGAYDGSMPDYKQVALPMGKLGVKFKGSKRATVSKVNAESPMMGSLPAGMAVDTISVDDRVHMEMNATEVAELIKATSSTPGRVMTVRDPASTDFQKIPDEIEVVLPSGKLGCTFRDKPPVPKSFKPESTIGAFLPPGMYVDRLTMPDGYTQAGFTTREFVTLLGFLSEEEGRTLTLRNRKLEPSPKEESFPEEMTVVLPTGKLGTSMKGKKSARISRLHEDSKLKGKVYVGMLIDTISIPGGSSFSGMTAKEAARVLVETKNVGGRTMTLRKPGSTLSGRAIPDDQSIGGSSQDMSEGFSTGSKSMRM